MRSKFTALLALTALSLSACGPAVHHEPKAKHAKTKLVTKKIYHFQDGRAGYQAPSGEWYYWIPDAGDIDVADTRRVDTSRTTQPGTAATGAITSTTASGSVAPASASAATSARGGFGSSAQTFGATGGQWSRGEAPKESELNQAEVTEETVAESPEGTPETAEQAEATDAAAEAADAADTAAEAAESSTDTSTDTSTDSGSTDSGSSDAGGGGDSGGGDGGGGGGE